MSVVIAGIGQTEYSKNCGRTAEQLALRAVHAALAEAGIPPGDVDGICRFGAPFETVTVQNVLDGLGSAGIGFLAEFPLGPDAIPSAVRVARHVIEAGEANVILLFRSIVQSAGKRYGRAGTTLDGEAGFAAPNIDDLSFLWPQGMVAPAPYFALQASAYQHACGISADELSGALSRIALAQRAYANRNPAALMRERAMDAEQYFASRMISTPLRLFDMCLENDGAAAIVITSAAYAKAVGSRAVPVLSARQGLARGHQMFSLDRPVFGSLVPQGFADPVFADAGIRPGRVRVAQLYDATSFMTLQALEAFGFAPWQGGWRHLTEAGIGPSSPLPVNTHGGNLSEAYLHGLNGFVEAVRQARGDAVNQVAGADISFFGSAGGGGVVLGSEA